MSCSLRSLRGVNFILTRSGKVLVQRRSMDSPTSPGMLCFPGGRIEEGETPIFAVKREVVEETGLSWFWLTPLCDVQYEWQGGYVCNRVYTASLPEWEEVKSLEGEMEWKTLQELETVELALGENILLPVIREVIMMAPSS